MNKKDREIVFNKYGGKCAFCGTDLSNGCHIWDIDPIKTMIDDSGNMEIVNQTIENCLPACKSCESTRRKHGNKMTIEEFREDIKEQFEFLRYGGITSKSYGKSIRFGLIKETGIEVKFYFEKHTLKINSNG